MSKIIAIHPVRKEDDAEHWTMVETAMDRLGAPAIRAFWSEDHNVWVAIEGSTRLAVAKSKGIIPTVIDVGGEDNLVHDIEGISSPCSVDVLAEALEDVRHLNESTWYECDE